MTLRINAEVWGKCQEISEKFPNAVNWSRIAEQAFVQYMEDIYIPAMKLAEEYPEDDVIFPMLSTCQLVLFKPVAKFPVVNEAIPVFMLESEWLEKGQLVMDEINGEGEVISRRFLSGEELKREWTKEEIKKEMSGFEKEIVVNEQGEEDVV